MIELVLEMDREAKMEWTQRCTWRMWLIEFGDALGGGDRASLEMHLEAVIERVWTCTWTPRSSKLWDAPRGCDRASLETHLQAMIKWDCRSTWRRSISREARWQLRLYSLVNLSYWECREMSTTSAERWGTGWEQETVDLGMMLYMVYNVLGVNTWSWDGEIDRDDLSWCS